MPVILRLALAFDIVAVVCEKVLPVAHGVLPIGGDHFVQAAAFVLAGVATSEILDLLKKKRR